MFNFFRKPKPAQHHKIDTIKSMIDFVKVENILDATFWLSPTQIVCVHAGETATMGLKISTAFKALRYINQLFCVSFSEAELSNWITNNFPGRTSAWEELRNQIVGSEVKSGSSICGEAECSVYDLECVDSTLVIFHVTKIASSSYVVSVNKADLDAEQQLALEDIGDALMAGCPNAAILFGTPDVA